MRLLDEIVDRGAPQLSIRTKDVLSALFNLAVDLGLMEKNAIAGYKDQEELARALSPIRDRPVLESVRAGTAEFEGRFIACGRALVTGHIEGLASLGLRLTAPGTRRALIFL